MEQKRTTFPRTLTTLHNAAMSRTPSAPARSHCFVHKTVLAIVVAAGIASGSVVLAHGDPGAPPPPVVVSNQVDIQRLARSYLVIGQHLGFEFPQWVRLHDVRD